MPHSEENLKFISPPEEHTFDGLLFDMDGTIIDSTDAIIKHWGDIGREIGVDPEVILATSHGRRSIDVLKEYDPAKANIDSMGEDVTRIEAQIPSKYGADAVEIPGSRALLDELDKAGVKWAIVTSGTRGLISGWLDIMKLAHPQNLIAAQDVKNGKPDPEGYLLGYRKLGLEDGGERSALVFEDAPAGVRAGKAAGFKVVALATTHTVRQLREAGADWIVRDMRSVNLKSVDKKTRKATLEISNALVA